MSTTVTTIQTIGIAGAKRPERVTEFMVDRFRTTANRNDIPIDDPRWDAENEVMARRTAELCARVVNYYDNDEEQSPAALEAAIAKTARLIIHEMLGNYHASRSTSAFSDAVAAAKREADSRFLSEYTVN